MLIEIFSDEISIDRIKACLYLSVFSGSDGASINDARFIG